MSIIVFDNHSLELNKYPRFYTDKETTDKIMITFFMNEEYLKNLSNSYENSVKYHNECKEYFYVFKTSDKKLVKKYSAKEIIQLINGINDFLRVNNDIKKQIIFLSGGSLFWNRGLPRGSRCQRERPRLRPPRRRSFPTTPPARRRVSG